MHLEDKTNWFKKGNSNFKKELNEDNYFHLFITFGIFEKTKKTTITNANSLKYKMFFL